MKTSHQMIMVVVLVSFAQIAQASVHPLEVSFAIDTDGDGEGDYWMQFDPDDLIETDDYCGPSCTVYVIEGRGFIGNIVDMYAEFGSYQPFVDVGEFDGTLLRYRTDYPRYGYCVEGWLADQEQWTSAGGTIIHSWAPWVDNEECHDGLGHWYSNYDRVWELRYELAPNRYGITLTGEIQIWLDELFILPPFPF